MKNIGDQEFFNRIKHRDKEEYEVDIGMSGCSCTLVIIIEKDIYTAHIGDGMLCLSKEYTSKFVEQNTRNDELILTKPLHLPDIQKEKMRIYTHRGEIRGNSY